jgi:NAD-dependent deacetylase
MESAIREAADIIIHARRLCAFTGAGMSVESGIPPFRGAEGIWGRYDPRMLELSYFDAHPEECWITIKEIFYEPFGRAEPNAGHFALAAMEAAGRLELLITQNIDDLHFRAGSRKVVEYHGNSRLLLCRVCGKKIEARRENLEVLPPKCPGCGGILKPDFVFFGELIPAEALGAAEEEMGKTDCLLVVGTTGEVFPAAALPHTASRTGAGIIEINPSPSTYTDTITDIYIPMPAGRALPLLRDLVLENRDR